jgi:hypothetical protein
MLTSFKGACSAGVCSAGVSLVWETTCKLFIVLGNTFVTALGVSTC